MVKKRNPPTLQSLSLSATAQILYNIRLNPTCLTTATEVLESYFQTPSRLKRELMEFLIKTFSLSSLQIYVLLHMGLEKIVLKSNQVPQRLGHLMKMTPTKYLKCVRMVDVSGGTGIPSEIIRELPSYMPDLTVLNVSETNCNDVCLNAIAENCRALRLLDLTQCPISDEGVAYLVNPDSSIVARSLQCLHIRGTAVTCDGAKNVLTSLKPLQVLSFDGLYEVFNRLYVDSVESNQQSALLQLREIVLTNIPLERRFNNEQYCAQARNYLFKLALNCLTFISNTCPKLTSICITCSSDILHNCFAQLVNCTDLRKVEIRCLSNRRHVNFHGLEPILTSSFISLNELVLCSVADLDLSVILEYAENLHTLLLYKVRLVNNKNVLAKENCLPLLKKLFIGNSEEKALTQLLKHCEHVEELSVYRMYDVNDAFFQKFENNLRQLQKLSLVYCVNVGNSGIRYLITDPLFDLKFLNLFECPSVKLKNLKLYIKKENFDVTVTEDNDETIYRGHFENYGSYSFPIL